VRNRADIDYLHRRTQHALGLSPGWNDVRLGSADGSQIFSASAGAGASLRKMELQSIQRQALTQTRPVISDLFLADEGKRPTVEISVPLLVNGKAAHLMVAHLDLTWFDTLLARQRSSIRGFNGGE